MNASVHDLFPATDNVAEILRLQQEETSLETDLDNNRWEQARRIAAELEGGKTQRALAAEIEKSAMHVNYMQRVWRDHGVNHGVQDGSSFDTYYQRVKAKRPAPPAPAPPAPAPRPVDPEWVALARAYVDEPWSATSWAQHCADRLDGGKAPRAEVPAVSEYLRREGLSATAIAAATGWSHPTIQGVLSKIPGLPTDVRTPNGETRPSSFARCTRCAVNRAIAGADGLCSTCFTKDGAALMHGPGGLLSGEGGIIIDPDAFIRDNNMCTGIGTSGREDMRGFVDSARAAFEAFRDRDPAAITVERGWLHELVTEMTLWLEETE